MNTSILKRHFGLAAIAVTMVVVAGHFSNVSAQKRDPFAKASFMKPKVVKTGSSSGNGTTAKMPVSYAPPVIDARIDYYKSVRESAVANGQTPPKVTSVLLVDELAVNGIFKTPRGYAAMVEATPIKLSYTIYPGEKFFDGQLVAVEENRLVFRKVTKTGPKKFVASVEYRPLQKFTMRSEIEGTAPAQGTEKQVQIAAAQPQPEPNGAAAPSTAPTKIVSPVDEMNSLPAGPAEKSKGKKDQKRPKVARKN